jgi:hypothetical protein
MSLDHAFSAPFKINPEHGWMKNVTAKAQATIPDLLRYAEEGGPQVRSQVLFPLRPDAGIVEHHWGVVVAFGTNVCRVRLIGKVGPDFQLLDEFREVVLSEVEDWAVYYSDGAYRGGFSYGVIALDHMQSGERYPDTLVELLGRSLDLTLEVLRELAGGELPSPMDARARGAQLHQRLVAGQEPIGASDKAEEESPASVPTPRGKTGWIN